MEQKSFASEKAKLVREGYK
jgi:hypothetical protein